ncbi:unnamed protein product, partial [Prunus brigantina]
AAPPLFEGLRSSLLKGPPCAIFFQKSPISLLFLVYSRSFFGEFNKVESISQGVENTLPTPTLGMSSVAADVAMRLPFPAGLPPTPSSLGTPNIASGTSSQLSAVLPRGEIIDDSHKNSDALTSIGHLS